MKNHFKVVSLTILCVILTTAPGICQETKSETPVPPEKTPQQKLFAQFSKQMRNSTLVGNFTIDGQPGKMKEERYELKGVSKLPLGDYWLFRARIRYGDHDVTVPLSLQVKWAASTPVITLDKVTVPGLGTFNARVLIDGDRYAGTWDHGEVGGLLFGRIEHEEPESPKTSKPAHQEEDDPS